MAIRVDLGRLRPAKTMPNGSMIFDAHITRAGVFEYEEKGKRWRELRTREEVFNPDSMASYAQMPVTPQHPPVPLDTMNSKKYMVGATGESVLRDDDHVRTSVMVADADTLALMKRFPEVSVGYKCDVIEEAGVHPEFGPYDKIQTNIRGNHLAVAVPVGRAGTAKVRNDGSQVRMDGAAVMVGSGSLASKLTTINAGHQHALIAPWSGEDQTRGETSYAISTGSDAQHAHAWVRNTDGSITIAVNEDHTHEVLAPEIPLPERLPVVADGQPVYDSAATSPGDNVSDKTKDLATLASQLAAAEQRATNAEAKVAAETARADAAEGRVAGLEKDVAGLRSERTDSDKIAEKDAEIQRLIARADAAERKLPNMAERIAAGVKARVSLERKAMKVRGEDFKMDGLTDREIMVEVVQKLHGVVIEAERSDDYARARFDAAIESWSAGSDALARLSEVAQPTPVPRTDAAPNNNRNPDAWKQPLPSTKMKGL